MSISTIEAPPGPADDDGYIENGFEALQRYLDAQVNPPGVSKTEVIQSHFHRNTRAGYGGFKPRLSNGLGHMALGGPWRDTNELMW